METFKDSDHCGDWTSALKTRYICPTHFGHVTSVVCEDDTVCRQIVCWPGRWKMGTCINITKGWVCATRKCLVLVGSGSSWLLVVFYSFLDFTDFGWFHWFFINSVWPVGVLVDFSWWFVVSGCVFLGLFRCASISWFQVVSKWVIDIFKASASTGLSKLFSHEFVTFWHDFGQISILAIFGLCALPNFVFEVMGRFYTLRCVYLGSWTHINTL